MKIVLMEGTLLLLLLTQLIKEIFFGIFENKAFETVLDKQFPMLRIRSRKLIEIKFSTFSCRKSSGNFPKIKCITDALIQFRTKIEKLMTSRDNQI